MDFLTKKTSVAAAFTAALSLVVIPAGADVTLSYSNPSNSAENMKMTVANNRAAMQFVDTSGDSTRMIFDKAENKLFLLMDSQKQYFDMDAMMEALGGLSGMLEGMMKDLPEDAKGQLGGILGGLMGGKDKPAPTAEPVLKETGKSEKIAGISCAVATLTSATQSTELCLAKPQAAGVSDADFAILRAMLVKQRESADKASEMLGIQDLGFNPGNIDRMPLRVKQLSGESAGSASELLAVEKTVDPSAVVIPADYQQAQLPGIQ